MLQTPSTATLRPERDKSVNFDQAHHIFIEGANLEVLKVLQKAYFGKVMLKTNLDLQCRDAGIRFTCL